MRTILYARFSNQYLQDAKSIADQISMLTEYAAREGWEIVDIFTDHGIDGGAGIEEDQRPGMAALLDRLTRRDIDQVFAESTDRIARHQGDSYTIRARIKFYGARLFVLGEGVIDNMKGTIKGLFDADFKEELGKKVKRGMLGTVADGRAPAGKAYGYRIANVLDEKGKLIRGLRAIDPDQAEIVRRIFTEYAAGLSTQKISTRLNADGIVGPSGGHWRSSTIHGDRQRQNGMLQNELYAGVRVYNKTSKVRDPETRKTLILPNPESEWRKEPVPDLRIIDDELWQLVQRQRRSYTPRQPQAYNRPKRLFSRLVRCGECGGAWIVVNGAYCGCARYKDGGGCSNKSRIRIDVMESRILAGLSEKIMQPELVSAYVAEFHREREAQLKAHARQYGPLSAELKQIDQRIANLVEAIADGGTAFPEIKSKLHEAKARKEQLVDQLAAIEDSRVVTLHPNLAEQYRLRWSNLQQALNDPSAKDEVVPALRAMIDRITITPPATGQGELAIEIYGKLAELLAFASGEKPKPQFTIAMERVKGIVRCSA